MSETIFIREKRSRIEEAVAPHSLTVSRVASREGISVGSLYNCRIQAKAEGKPVPGSNKISGE